MKNIIKGRENKDKLISKQQGCWGDTEVQAAIMQTTICIILCVVIRVTAGSGSYLRATCFPSRPARLCSSQRWTGGIPQPCDYCVNVFTCHPCACHTYLHIHINVNVSACLHAPGSTALTAGIDSGPSPYETSKKISVMATSDTMADFLNWAADKEKVNF